MIVVAAFSNDERYGKIDKDVAMDAQACIATMDNPQRSFSLEKNVHRLTH
nr:MAG TPA: hypothetical protein [Caudoviricetes sp.]